MFIPFRINWEVVYSFLLGVFAFFGLCPISRRSSGKSKINTINFSLLLWSAFHLIFAVTIATIAAQIFTQNDGDGASSFNNLLKFFALSLTHVVTCVESVYVRKNFIEIWNRVHLIDDMMGNILQDYQETKTGFFKATSKKVIVCMLLTIAIELAIITSIHNVKDWALIWWVLIAPSTISRLRHLQHTLYIDLLASRFRTIKNELNVIVKLTKLEPSKIISRNLHFYDGLFKRISTIKSVYNVLWETSLYINRSFGLSQLVNLLQNFIQLTCDLYLVYSFLYNNSLEYIIGK